MRTILRRAALAAPILLALGSSARADDDLPPLSVYGFVRLDAIVDDSTMNDVEAPHYVDSERGPSNAEMTIHPRLTRFGLSVDQYELTNHWDAKGQIEVDFQDSSAGDASGAASIMRLRLRHAFVSLTRQNKVELLAGQTWDLISPLFPSVNNDSMMWDAGNTGAFRPQLRLSLMPSDKVRLAVAAGATGVVDRQDADGDGHLDGVASGLPTWEFLAEYRTRAASKDPMRIGVWGHTAREQLGDGTDLKSYSIGMHLFFPIGPRVILLGELFQGKNLDDIRGGIGQGYDPVRHHGIKATGGWVELANVITSRHMLAFGETFDLVPEADVMDGARTKNLTGYGVFRYKPRDSFQLGFEYSYWRTDYRNMNRGTANRFDVHASVFF